MAAPSVAGERHSASPQCSLGVLLGLGRAGAREAAVQVCVCVWEVEGEIRAECEVTGPVIRGQAALAAEWHIGEV